jgi:formate hydrogenlyase subunit 3/multisubunit Na+/H+ antiporter MnhD subunit
LLAAGLFVFVHVSIVAFGQDKWWDVWAATIIFYGLVFLFLGTLLISRSARQSATVSLIAGSVVAIAAAFGHLLR